MDQTLLPFIKTKLPEALKENRVKYNEEIHLNC